MEKKLQETIIKWDAAHLMASVETYQKKIWKHLEKKELPVKPKEITNLRGEMIGKSFLIPKDWIHFYKPKRSYWKNNISDLFKKFKHSK